MTARRRLLLALLALMAGLLGPAATSRAADRNARYAAIRRLIKKNLHFSAHMVWAVNTDTVVAVRKEVTEADIPVLVELLGDRENVVGIGAQHVLATFGAKAVGPLEAAARSPDYGVASKARDALDAIHQAGGR